MITTAIYFVLAALVGFTEAIKERVGLTATWKQTKWFKDQDPKSYWGSRETTSYRKHRWKNRNKWLDKFMTTWGVGLTDVWHGCDTILHSVLFLFVPLIIWNTGYGQIHLLGWPVMATMFHISYHHILLSKPKATNP